MLWPYKNMPHERKITSAKIKERVKSRSAKNQGAQNYEHKKLRSAGARKQKREM
jgi:hypothetical protein